MGEALRLPHRLACVGDGDMTGSLAEGETLDEFPRSAIQKQLKATNRRRRRVDVTRSMTMLKIVMRKGWKSRGEGSVAAGDSGDTAGACGDFAKNDEILSASDLVRKDQIDGRSHLPLIWCKTTKSLADRICLCEAANLQKKAGSGDDAD